MIVIAVNGRVMFLAPWEGVSIPGGRRLGEWCYVGRLLDTTSAITDSVARTDSSGRESEPHERRVT